jgi:hypothetical protein
MKAKNLKYLLPVGMGLTLIIMTVFVFLTLSLTSCAEDCDSDEVWCSNAEVCCPADKPYHDGNGHCWVDMGSCRWASSKCELCTDQD